MRIVPPQNNTTTFNERRRHARHKVPSIIYVGLDAGNGGIIINLSAGGLSLQAVAELNPETELTLHFRMQGAEHAIETMGRVTWLGPTQKEAGICFKNLPDNTEQQIAEWIARLEEPAPTTGTGTESRPSRLPQAVKRPGNSFSLRFKRFSLTMKLKIPTRILPQRCRVNRFRSLPT